MWRYGKVLCQCQRYYFTYRYPAFYRETQSCPVRRWDALSKSWREPTAFLFCLEWFLIPHGSKNKDIISVPSTLRFYCLLITPEHGCFKWRLEIRSEIEWQWNYPTASSVAAPRCFYLKLKPGSSCRGEWVGLLSPGQAQQKSLLKYAPATRIQVLDIFKSLTLSSSL